MSTGEGESPAELWLAADLARQHPRPPAHLIAMGDSGMRTNLGHLLAVAASLVISSLSVAAEDSPERLLRAGAANTDITPPLGETIVGGFAPFPATAVHDKLYARCLVLDNGEIYGWDIVALSEGELSKGSIYFYLSRMDDKVN